MSDGTPALQVTVEGIGVLGPGLGGWPQTRAVLRDPSSWRPVPTVLPPPARLPAAERRRSGSIVKLSLAVADEACLAAAADPRDLATVFASSVGDTANCHALCETLAMPERAVSPTRFTNSVHNAAAGYWHIATASRAPSTSLCAFDASFGAGLLEAASQCAAWQRPVLLVCGDVPYPEPLHAVRPLPDAFGIALLLAPGTGSDAAPARLALRAAAVAAPDASSPWPAESGEADDALSALARTVPAARGLPLLSAIARGQPATVTLDDLRSFGLVIDVAPGRQG